MLVRVQKENFFGLGILRRNDKFAYTTQEHLAYPDALRTILKERGVEPADEWRIHSSFVDMDADRDLDWVIFVRTQDVRREPGIYFRRDGDSYKVVTGADNPLPSVCWNGQDGFAGHSFVDADADGDLDLAVNCEGRFTLWRRDGLFGSKFTELTGNDNPFRDLTGSLCPAHHSPCHWLCGVCTVPFWSGACTIVWRNPLIRASC